MKRLSVAMCAVVMWSCTDGSVGSEDCFGERVRCQLPRGEENLIRLAGMPLPEVPTRDLRELTPTWIRPMPTPMPADAFWYSWDNMLLTNDFEGDVWFFEQREKQLIANNLDGDGEVTESRAFDAPRDWKVGDAGTLQLSSYQQSAKGPTLRVTWPASVKGEALDPLASLEWIKFGDSFDAPRRLIANEDSPYWDLELIWDADDTIYGMKSRYTADNGIVEKFDRKGRRVWSQTAMSRVEPGGREKFFALLGDHQVGMFVAGPSSGVAGSVIDADGNYTAQLGMPYWATDLKPLEQILRQGAKGPVIVSGTSDGHLIVANLQLKLGTLGGVRILRDDYLPFNDAPSAIDPRGNVYVAMLFGGREISDQGRAICRVPFEGEPACMQLARSPELEITEHNRDYMEIATNADGVVFMRTEKVLARIDFPGR